MRFALSLVLSLISLSALAQQNSALVAEIQNMHQQLRRHWHPPKNISADAYVVMRLRMRSDGAVENMTLIRGTGGPSETALFESAKKAVKDAQPFKGLSSERYKQWRDMEILFQPPPRSQNKER